MWPGIVHLDVYLKKNVLYVYVSREKCWLFLEFLSEIKPESFCLSVCISSVLNTEERWVWSFCRATISPGQFSVEWLMRHRAYPPKWTGAIMLSPQSYGAGGERRIPTVYCFLPSESSIIIFCIPQMENDRVQGYFWQLDTESADINSWHFFLWYSYLGLT